MTALLDRLPPVRGRYQANAPLGARTWFACGGTAEVLFRPADVQDLQAFLRFRPVDVPYTVLGAGSNVLVRDGGVPGVVIRLGGPFVTVTARFVSREAAKTRRETHKVSVRCSRRRAADGSLRVRPPRTIAGGVHAAHPGTSVPGSPEGQVFRSSGCPARDLSSCVWNACEPPPCGAKCLQHALSHAKPRRETHGSLVSGVRRRSC